jgi:hypothetical protein
MHIAGALLLVLLTCRVQAQVQHELSWDVYTESGGIRDTAVAPMSSHETASTASQVIYNLDFPRFDVYSPSGTLVNHTPDVKSVRSILRNCSRASKRLSLIPGTETWSQVVRRFPQLNCEPDQYIVLSNAIADCEDCRTEAALLDNAEAQLAAQRVRQQALVLKP